MERQGWFIKESIANIISLADMASKYKVTYDSDRAQEFLVHMPIKIVQFRQMSNGLYAMNLLSKGSYTKTNKFQFVETVEENMGFLIPQ